MTGELWERFETHRFHQQINHPTTRMSDDYNLPPPIISLGIKTTKDLLKKVCSTGSKNVLHLSKMQI